MEKREMKELQSLLDLFSEKTRRPHSSRPSAWRRVEIWNSHIRALNEGSLGIAELKQVPLRLLNDHLQVTQSARLPGSAPERKEPSDGFPRV